MKYERVHSVFFYFFSLSASQPIVGLYSQSFSGLLASSFEVSRSHNDAPQSVGLLQTSDQFVAETST